MGNPVEGWREGELKEEKEMNIEGMATRQS